MQLEVGLSPPAFSFTLRASDTGGGFEGVGVSSIGRGFQTDLVFCGQVSGC